jgi:hypothetical protein
VWAWNQTALPEGQVFSSLPPVHSVGTGEPPVINAAPHHVVLDLDAVIDSADMHDIVNHLGAVRFRYDPERGWSVRRLVEIDGEEYEIEHDVERKRGVRAAQAVGRFLRGFGT